MSSRRRRQTRNRDLVPALQARPLTVIVQPAPAPTVEPELMLVRHLGPEHLGKTIYLEHDDPAVDKERRMAKAIGGTLVGFRPGDPDKGGHFIRGLGDPGFRILVIQQGNSGMTWHASLNHPVIVHH